MPNPYAKYRYYQFDDGSCDFVPVGPSPSRTILKAGVFVVSVLLVAWVVQGFHLTPEEIANEAEREALEGEIAKLNERIEVYAESVARLEQSDRDLYTLLLEVDPVSEDVQKMGVGGSDPYQHLDRFGPETSSLLREGTAKLDQLENRINLQSSRYRQLVALATDREALHDQIPAILPVDGRVVSGFGIRMHPILNVHKMHYGIDILAKEGLPIFASADGVIGETGYNDSYGYHVVIEHPVSGYTTLYAHLSKIEPGWWRGRVVERGDVIGYSGSTGRSTGTSICHFEIRKDGRAVNPIAYLAPSMTPTVYRKLVQDSERYTRVHGLAESTLSDPEAPLPLSTGLSGVRRSPTPRSSFPLRLGRTIHDTGRAFRRVRRASHAYWDILLDPRVWCGVKADSSG